MKIAIFGNTYQSDKSAQAKHLFEALQKHDAEIWICHDFYQFLQDSVGLTPRIAGFIDSNDFDANIALSVGGDGTYLKTAERVGEKAIPILGINTGRLGFLADVSAQEIEDTITEIFKNYYLIEKRSLLQMQTPNLPDSFSPFGLNEIAISKRDTSSMITIHTWIDDAYLNSFQADGLIIATPTGSTAYSLSVGGPVLVPQSHNFVITAVAPHSLNVRPLVINDDCTIRLEVESRSQNFLIGIDGRPLDLDTNRSLTIQKAPFYTHVVKRHRHVFYDTLRNKLMWGADKRSIK